MAHMVRRPARVAWSVLAVAVLALVARPGPTAVAAQSGPDRTVSFDVVLRIESNGDLLVTETARARHYSAPHRP